MADAKVDTSVKRQRFASCLTDSDEDKYSSDDTLEQPAVIAPGPCTKPGKSKLRTFFPDSSLPFLDGVLDELEDLKNKDVREHVLYRHRFVAQRVNRRLTSVRCCARRYVVTFLSSGQPGCERSYCKSSPHVA